MECKDYDISCVCITNICIIFRAREELVKSISAPYEHAYNACCDGFNACCDGYWYFLMLMPFYFVHERFSGVLRYAYLKHA